MKEKKKKKRGGGYHVECVMISSEMFDVFIALISSQLFSHSFIIYCFSFSIDLSSWVRIRKI